MSWSLAWRVSEIWQMWIISFPLYSENVVHLVTAGRIYLAGGNILTKYGPNAGVDAYKGNIAWLRLCLGCWIVKAA